MKNRFLSALLFTLSAVAGYTQEKGIQQDTLVIAHVNVIPMAENNSILYNKAVVIVNSRIERIGGSLPKNATVVDAKGKWLIPGLIDMHVHLPSDLSTGSRLPAQSPDIVFDVQDIMTPFIANGVTTIFNLNANAESFYQRKEIQTGKVTGPRIALAALINGGSGSGRIANTASDGRQAVRDVKAEGYEFIKLYSGLDIATYNAIIDEAHLQGLKTVGHIPDVFREHPEQAFVPHFDMVAHAEEFSKSAEEFSYEEAKRLAALAKENGSWVTPTLTAMDWISSQTRSMNRLRSSATIQYVHPLLQSKWLTANSYSRNSSPERIAYFEKMVAFQVLLVRAFKEYGVPVVAGTDAGVSGVVSGFALHDELELLVKAGLTPGEALTAATRLPALWLGMSDQVGTIEAGKLADLILLDGNPLEDIKNTRKIAGVLVNGRWLSNERLRSLLADLSQRNAASKDRFDWNKTMKK